MIKSKVNYTLLIVTGIIIYSNYIGTIVNCEKKKTIQILQEENIEKNYRMANWVGHSLLEELYYNIFFKGKGSIEYLEANFTRAPIDVSNPDSLAVDEEGNYDEAITAVAKASNDM